MKRLIVSTEKIRKYSDIYNKAYKIYKESFGNISKVWDYVKSEIIAGNIPDVEGRMLVKDVTAEYLRDNKPKSRVDKYKDIFNSGRG